jgi:hypothetical protein
MFEALSILVCAMLHHFNNWLCFYLAEKYSIVVGLLESGTMTEPVIDTFIYKEITRTVNTFRDFSHASCNISLE